MFSIGLEKGVLLGDSGYSCRPFLLTSYLNPTSEREERYNRAHTSTRNAVERTFGVWKRKFHVLHSEVRMKPAKVSRVIVACAVLHNLAILWNEPEPQEPQDDDEQPQPDQYQGPQDGRGVRNYVTNTFF
ncbi:putative nuclease HARBI1 isoform X1 [Mercenaria mercenaria]|uniref:putative nuclease HARBI1 isoform X1 n=1 Tax=Mercenaria mercenaria TaxID=6596 RepID=UPI00234EDD22|nr:putative nuclease HARBI1 isoform X1 [Mercenaria mercenaria]